MEFGRIVFPVFNEITPMKALELGRLEPYRHLHAQQLMDLVHCCRELTIAAGRRFEIRDQAMRGQCFLLDGTVDLCAASRMNTRVLERVSHRDSRALQPLLDSDGQNLYIHTRTRSRILVVDTEVRRSPSNLHVTPVGSRDEDAWMRVFLGGSLASRLRPSTLRDLFREFKTEKVCKGQVVGRIGEPSKRFHVIKRGQVHILDQVTLAVLGPGEFFGEDSLIRGCARNATVESLCDGELLWISGDAFQRLLRSRFVRELPTGLAAARVHLVSEGHGRDDSAHLNLELSLLRDSMHLFDLDTSYLLSGEPGEVELGAFILTHHGYDAYARQESYATA